MHKLRRGTEMNSSNPLQTEESGIGNDIYYAASAVSPNANHQVQRIQIVVHQFVCKTSAEKKFLSEKN
jgi:hypothetical protein